MKTIKKSGIVVFVIGLVVFTAASFYGDFKLKRVTLKSEIDQLVENEKIQPEVSQLLKERYESADVTGKVFHNPIAFSKDIIRVYDDLNEEIKANKDWDNVMQASSSDVAFSLARKSANNIFDTYPWLLFFLTFGLAILGGLMYMLPDVILLGGPGIKNDHIYHSSATNRGWVGVVVFAYLIGFYIILYFYHHLLVNQVEIVNPLSKALSGNPSSRWFLYGFMYCAVMVTMSVRMYIKYRHNIYQMVRTTSVLFFQIAFAFLIPEIMVRFNQPYMDLKNAWPLNYSFFYSYNIDQLQSHGLIGAALLVWGVVLALVVVPVLAYIYGKRWYCSWVCGCGGLAETLGDPYRQLSSKKLVAWQIERWLVHGVLVFAIVMTVITVGANITNSDTFLGFPTYMLTSAYGFLIGSIFAGVIGTGFYPMLGNRVWCRFGCPLAAYLGIVQRFKSRFRITTNGGQCISCGNCSTYCEQGIDVRAYAQKGENIVRASCVGCGVCAAVCPRGVLKLENGPEIGRINSK